MMTWAQMMFLFCGMVLVPVSAFACAFRRAGNGRSGWMGLFLGGFVTGGVLVVMAAVAKFSFPEYPSQPMDERLAVALTVPVLGAGLLLLLRWPARQRPVGKRRIRWSEGLLVGTYGAGLCLTYHVCVSPIRQALPWGADEIRDSTRSEFLLPDYTTYLSARISQREFEEYMIRLDLGYRGVERLSWRADRAAWWRVPEAEAPVYSVRKGDFGMEAAYADGRVWVKAWEE